LLIDGKVQTDDRGKGRYTAILEWATKEMQDRFSAAVCAAVEGNHPGTFA
jgi:hypothetical protein